MESAIKEGSAKPLRIVVAYSNHSCLFISEIEPYPFPEKVEWLNRNSGLENQNKKMLAEIE